MDTMEKTRSEAAEKTRSRKLSKETIAHVGRAMVAFERVFFPLMFLLFALVTITHFFMPLEEPVLGKSSPFAVSTLFFQLLLSPGTVAPDTSGLHAWALFGQEVVRPLVLFFFEILCAGFILLRRGIRYTPTSINEVVLPLAGTFVVLLLPLSSQVGALGRPFALPDHWLVPLFAAGTAMGLAGAALSVYALMYLRLNFSIFVEVREVVLDGPYRYVRHPMYLGEIIMVSGVVLTQLSPFSIGLVGCLILTQYLRARMEQTRLSEASPEYARNLEVSGMFFPKIGR